MDPFLGEIRAFGFSFAPQGWALCNGQILSIAQNTALFSLLGTNYGGNGTSNFALPDLQGRIPMGSGDGPGLTPRVIGEEGGEENVTLLSTEIPAHTHAAVCNSGDGDQYDPAGHFWAQDVAGNAEYSTAGSSPMNAAALVPSGSSTPHTNLQPYLVANYCIALQGIFPSRS